MVFFRFRTALALALILAGALPSLGQGQVIKDIFPQWRYIQSNGQSLYGSLADKALLRLDERKQQINALQSEKSWTDRQQQIKKTYAQVLGAFPKKTPLNTVVTGIVKNDGIEVRKVYFESIPGYYVTGALFLPEQRKGKLPAILFCSGHSKTGFRGSYQHSILNFVKKGFAVFAFDPIGQGERQQFAGDTTKKGFSPTQEHSYPGSQVFLAGRSPAYYFIWDGIRAIDYLSSLPEVDASRIGLTGRSGGGTQTAYIAAFDNRVKAAAPECYTTSYEYLLKSMGPQDAEQNFLGGIAAGLNIADLLIAYAPKPLLLVTTTRDIFSIQGARDAFAETKLAYSAFKKPELVGMVEDDAEHASTLKNREATYQFFQKYLLNPGNFKDEEVKFFKREDLTVTPGGNVFRSLHSSNLQALASGYGKEMESQRSPIASDKDLKNRIIDVTGFAMSTDAKSAVFCGKYQRDGYDVEAYMIKGPSNYYIPFYQFVPRANIKEGKSVLLLDDRGKSEAIKIGAMADSLVHEGYKVVIPDLSGFGELGNGYIKGGDAYVDGISMNLWYTGLLINQSLLGLRLNELSAIVSWMKANHTEIKGVASGVLTTDLLHLAVLQQNDISDILLVDPLISFQSVIQNPNYKAKYILSSVAGMIKQYDLYHLINAYSKNNNLVLINPRNGAGQIITGQDQFTKYDIKPDLFLTIKYGDNQHL